MTIKKAPNTECVYETIGNYPVVDQFDVLYKGMLSGTYMDNYVTGSLLTFNPFVGTFEQGERGLAFSKLDENKGYPVDITNPTNWNSYNLQPWTERSETIRNLRIFSSSERYYDSQPPDSLKLAEELGGGYYQVNNNLIFIGFAAIPIANSPFGFPESFPFEGKFYDVPKINFLTNIRFGYNTGGNPLVWEGDMSNVLPAIKETSAKIAFGFGDLNLRYSSGAVWYGSKNLLEFRKSDPLLTQTIVYGPVQRGWKYGLIDGNPHYTSIIFRRDRYGQHRDMLEQRYSAVTITDPARSPTKYFGSTEKPALSPSQFDETPSFSYDPPVKVNFVKPEIISNKLIYLSQQPEATLSSNLSTYATSSLPYFDGDARNRDPLV